MSYIGNHMEYERVGPLISLTWPGSLRFARGSKIRVVGFEMKPMTVLATTIIDAEGRSHERSGELPPGLREDRRTAFTAKVVACTAHRDTTILSLYPLNSKAFRFGGLAAMQPFLLVPEFWAFLEDRADWEEFALSVFIPRPYEEVAIDTALNVADTSWALQRQGQLTGQFLPRAVGEIFGVIVKKLERCQRLIKKALFLDDFRRHMIVCSSSQRRNWALEETLPEGAMLLEQAATVIYSVLDVFAHLVNATYCLQIPDLVCGFTTLLGRTTALIDENESSWSGLEPSEPLHQLLASARDGWLGNLRGVRHFVAHKGYVLETHGPSAEAQFMVQLDPAKPYEASILPVRRTIEQWFEQLVELLNSSFLEMKRRADILTQEISEVAPLDPLKPANVNTTAIELLIECTRLLMSTLENEPNRVQFLYSRLSSTWRASWSLIQFEKFLGSLTQVKTDPRFGVSEGSNGIGQKASLRLLCLFQNKPVSLVLETSRMPGRRPQLVLTPSSFPQWPEFRVSVSKFSAKQSGPETGHKRVEFRLEIINLFSGDLEDVHVHIFHSEVRWANYIIGNLSVQEVKIVELSTSDEVAGVRAPGGQLLQFILLQEPVRVRVTFNLKTDYGNLWANDYIAGGWLDEPEPLKQS